MPRIEAATVAEHRANVTARLIDAAEEILRSGSTRTLTAGAVSAAAGIARNSIYRYVDSVDDLRLMVVNRYLPDWLDAVATSLEEATAPESQVVAWVRANLEQSALAGHGWLMDAVRAMSGNPHLDEAVTQAHARMWQSLTESWQALLVDDPDRVPIAVALTLGILEAGFRQLAADRPAELVITMCSEAARALTTALRAT